MPRLIIANWKMNLSCADAVDLAEKLSAINQAEFQLVIAPSALHIGKISGVVASSKIKLAAQDLSSFESGAYTGENSAACFAELGCKYSIIGHSERRIYLNESADIIQKKVTNSLNAGLTPIVCVGESLMQNNSVNLEKYLAEQLIYSLPANLDDEIIIAYEPVWAIGSGVSASIDHIENVLNLLKDICINILGLEKKAKLLYGGSVNLENCKNILSINVVDGLLVGSASNNFENFIQMLR